MQCGAESKTPHTHSFKVIHNGTNGVFKQQRAMLQYCVLKPHKDFNEFYQPHECLMDGTLVFRIHYLCARSFGMVPVGWIRAGSIQ